jgi:hypothetical protein
MEGTCGGYPPIFGEVILYKDEENKAEILPKAAI